MQPSVRECPLPPRSPPADAACTVHALWDWGGSSPAAERGADSGQAGNQQPPFPVVFTPTDVLYQIPALLLLPWTAPKKKKVSPMRVFSTRGGSVLVRIHVNSLTPFPVRQGWMLTSAEPRSGNDPRSPRSGLVRCRQSETSRHLTPRMARGPAAAPPAQAGSETKPGRRLSGVQVTSLRGWGLRFRADATTDTRVCITRGGNTLLCVLGNHPGCSDSSTSPLCSAGPGRLGCPVCAP